MIPLRIALVHADHPRLMEHRAIGPWSYAVPQFEVTHVPVAKRAILRTATFEDVDVIVWEDSRLDLSVRRSGNAPLVYMVGDSTLSPAHYQHRHAQAEYADLLLVDWDRLDRYTDTGKPVRRLSYCTNDRLFVPLEKDLDVCFYHGKSPERADLGVWLQALCAARGWSYVGGLVPGPLYAEGMGRARVVVNLNRNAETRAHRTFDAMACRACFLTSPQPRVSGEVRADGVHYLTWYGRDQLEALLDLMLRGNRWETFGNAGYELILTEHTWQIRAAQLYALLIEEFPHLQERIHARVH